MRLVVFTEEASMKAFLDVPLPRILPPGFLFKVVEFSGCGDLERNVPIKLSAWNEPEVRFVIVEDQDNADCRQRKEKLQAIAARSGKDVLVRIVCRELESWYFGDLEAVEQAYEIPGLAKKYSKKRKYRDPDAIVDAKEQFKDIVREHTQIQGAKRIAPYIDIERNRSASFQQFVSGINRIIEEAICVRAIFAN